MSSQVHLSFPRIKLQAASASAMTLALTRNSETKHIDAHHLQAGSFEVAQCFPLACKGLWTPGSHGVLSAFSHHCGDIIIRSLEAAIGVLSILSFSSGSEHITSLRNRHVSKVCFARRVGWTTAAMFTSLLPSIADFQTKCSKYSTSIQWIAKRLKPRRRSSIRIAWTTWEAWDSRLQDSLLGLPSVLDVFK